MVTKIALLGSLLLNLLGILHADHDSCGPGRAGIGGSGMEPCYDCEVGRYSDAERYNSYCYDCPPGRAQGSQGQSSCPTCVPGTYQSAYGAAVCDFCDPGKAEPNYEATDCGTVCYQPGRYSAGGQADCSDCAAGTFVTDSGSSTVGNTGCNDCPAGKSTNGVQRASECIDCEPGYYQGNNGRDECNPCDYAKNEYSDQYGALSCSFCADGYGADDGADGCTICDAGFERLDALDQDWCTICPVNTFNEVDGDFCIACEAGKISAEGAAEQDSCVAPESNFYTSLIVFFICIPVAFEYVIHARFHRMAFLRTERVTKKIIGETRAVVASLFHYAVRARAERKRDRKYRFLKTWLFLLWSLITVFVITLLSFISQMSGVLFASMILWKNLSSSLAESFNAILQAAVDAVSSLIEFEVVYYFFYAIMVVFDFFANFTISIDAIDVTCEGAQAPVELFINLVILGFAIVIIESNIQIFRAITFNTMTDKFIECFTQPVYRTWAFRGRGEHRRSTWHGRFSYALTGLSALAIRGLAAIDIVQSFLQYIMSLVTTDLFFPVHNYTVYCNSVEGYEGFDEGLASISTIFAWLLLIPFIYEVAKILAPGLPVDHQSVDNVSNKRDPKSSMLHIGKYLSLLSLDLWLVVISQGWTSKVRLETPNEAGSNTNKLLSEESTKRSKRRAPSLSMTIKSMEQVAAAQKALENDGETSVDDITGELEMAESTSAELAEAEATGQSVKNGGEIEVAADGKVVESPEPSNKDKATKAPAFKIVSTGTFAKSTDGSATGFYVARAGYSVHVWAHVHLPHPDTHNYWVFCRLSREDGELLLIQTYDIADDGKHTDGRGAAALAADLNASDDSHLVVVFSMGDPATPNALKDGLPEAAARCGAFLEHFGQKDEVEQDGAYALVGVPGCGEGRGFEAIAGNKEHALIEAEFELTPAGFRVMEMHVEEVEDFLCLSSDSYLLATLRKRTAEENMLWRDRQRRSLPSMWTLCKLEMYELLSICGSGRCFCWPFALFFVVFQFGHLFTAVGRKSWYLVCWKYITFVQTCFGYWTPDAVSAYSVHEHIRSASVVWDKPIRRMTKDEYAEYRKDLALKSGYKRFKQHNSKVEQTLSSKIRTMEADAKDAKAKERAERGEEDDEKESRKNKEVENTEEGEDKDKAEIITITIDGVDYALPEESEEQALVQQEELKRSLRSDYSMILHCLTACRATLLIIVPGLASLTILASTMATTPLFVYDKTLHLNLPEVFISHPFEEARALEQEMVEEQEHVRETEMTENDHDVPNPTQVYFGGRWVVVPTAKRAAIEEANEESRKEMRVLMTQLPRKVEEWRVLVQGIALMVIESRGFNFGVNLYKYILTMALVVGGTDYIYFWMITACVILIPYGVVVAMKANLIIGRAMDITDEDLHLALGCLGLGCLLTTCGISAAEGEEEGSEAGSDTAGGAFKDAGGSLDPAEAEKLLAVAKAEEADAKKTTDPTLSEKIREKEAEAKAQKARENAVA